MQDGRLDVWAKLATSPDHHCLWGSHQRVKDFGGWIIGAAGLIFLLSENLEMRFYVITTFLFPELLILVGLNTIIEYLKKGTDTTGK
jgi:hypothetical protein